MSKKETFDLIFDCPFNFPAFEGLKRKTWRRSATMANLELRSSQQTLCRVMVQVINLRSPSKEGSISETSEENEKSSSEESSSEEISAINQNEKEQKPHDEIDIDTEDVNESKTEIIAPSISIESKISKKTKIDIPELDKQEINKIKKIQKKDIIMYF